MQKQIKQNLVWRGLYFTTNLICSILISRSLGAESFAKFSYSITLASLFILVFSLNIESALIYFISSQKASKQIIQTVIIASLTLFFILYFILNKILFDCVIFYNNISYNVDYELFTKYLSGFFLIGVGCAIFNGLMDFKTANLLLFIANCLLITLIFKVNMGFSNHRTIILYFSNINFYTGIVVLLFALFKLNQSSLLTIENTNSIFTIYKYSIIIMLSNLVFFFVYRVDFWFVEHWISSKKQTGNYFQASKLVQMILVLPQIIAGALIPILSSRPKTENNERIIKIVRLLNLFVFIIFFINLLIGKWLLPIIFGISFNEMWLCIVLLFPGIYCLTISTILSAYFSSINKNKINLFGAFVALFIMIFSSLIFYKNYSIQTAAIISSVSYFSEFLVVYLFFKKEVSLINFKDLLFSFKDLTILKESIMN